MIRTPSEGLMPSRPAPAPAEEKASDRLRSRRRSHPGLERAVVETLESRRLLAQSMWAYPRGRRQAALPAAAARRQDPGFYQRRLHGRSRADPQRAGAGDRFAGYFNGDINYDGVIDAVDYGIIDNTIQLQAPPIQTTVTAITMVASILDGGRAPDGRGAGHSGKKSRSARAP
jgi:hypothetical protein